jgi:RNA polymerase-binding transcription factor DksA
MEEKDLEFFRNHLIKWLEELLANADETKGKKRNSTTKLF